MYNIHSYIKDAVIGYIVMKTIDFVGTLHQLYTVTIYFIMFYNLFGLDIMATNRLLKNIDRYHFREN